MAMQEENVCESSQETEGCLPPQGVAHERSVVVGKELVQVVQGLERSSDHLVGKELHADDAGMELLPNKQMAGFEDDEIAQAQRSLHHSRRERPFLGEGNGRAMDRYVSGQVETALPPAFGCQTPVQVGFDRAKVPNIYPVDLELLVERAHLLAMEPDEVCAASPRLRGSV